MAPSSIDSRQKIEHTLTAGPSTDKPSIYLLEAFPLEAVSYCQTQFNTVLSTDAEIHNWHENATSILVRELIISAEDIARAPKLRAIGKQGTGIDIIDQDACVKRGIPIFNTPGVNAQSVAELVLALTMSVARQLRTISVNQALGKEVRKEHCCGTMINGKTIGVLGMGNIGTAVARIFRGAFNTPIYAYDPFAPAYTWSDIPHIRVLNFEEMLPHVDMLTLYVPLNAKTRGMISMPQFLAMKSTAILINVARGGIVNEDDMVIALNKGLIYGAGLDCHEEEPPTLQRYKALWETGRVISTPHIGATTAQTQVQTATEAIDHVFKYLTTARSVM